MKQKNEMTTNMTFQDNAQPRSASTVDEEFAPDTEVASEAEVGSTAPTETLCATYMDAGFAHTAALQYLASPETPEIVRWCGVFYEYDDGTYNSVTDEHVKLCVTRFLSRKIRARKTPKTWDEVPVTESSVRDVMLSVRAETTPRTGVEVGGWLKPPPFEFIGPLLSTNGGLVDIGRVGTTGSYLLPSTPNLFSQTALPVCPDPFAPCRRWLDFVDETFAGDAAAISRLQEIFGYCLLPDCRLERFFLLYGDGDSGKSTVAEILHALLGGRNVSAVPLEDFGRRFGLAQMIDKLANIVFDSAEIDQAGEGPLKAIVSGEPVCIDRKHLPAITARLTCKLIFVSNSLPAFRDTSTGLWRRVLILRFSHVMPKDRQDKTLKMKLKHELPGIAHWALQGLARLLAQGGFTAHEPSELLLAGHRRACNPVGLFLDAACVLDGDARVPRQEAYKCFKDWSKDNGFKEISATKFYSKIDEICRQPESPSRAGRAGDRYLTGFRLNSSESLASQFQNLGRIDN